jgi:hypothetical protein
MKKIYIDDLYDYDYSKQETEKGAIHTLFASDQDHWSDSFKDEEVLSITDTGDGFVFNHSCPEEEMDYHYALQLSILLKIIIYNDHKIETCKKELL